MFGRGWIVCLMVVLSVAVVPARAEVTVSITISGPVEELVPILQKLQELGLGGATATADPLKLNVHSFMTEEEKAAAESPQPAIKSVTVEPASAKAGGSVLIAVSVADPNRAIDTVAATIGDTKVDLFDNGTEGDVTAGDGVWSRMTALPAGLAPGEVEVSAHAYNANGEAVYVPGANGEPTALTALAKVAVTP